MERELPVDDGLDALRFREDKTIMKALGPNEQILMSCLLYKYNKRLKRQERSLLITSRAVYNVNKQDFLANIISVFNSSYAIRRRIDVTKLMGITVSEMSSEFVLHVRDEYDYRYSSPDKRDKILTTICKAYYMNITNKPLIFFFKDDINLIQYTTTEDDKKKGEMRMPKEDATQMDEDALQQKIQETIKRKEKLKADTETVFTKDQGNRVTLDDFEILKVLGRGAFGKVMLVEKKDNKQVYALKSMHKEDIIDKDQIEHTKTERFVLEKSKSPFLVSLEYAFQTPSKVFFVMKFMKGGELFQHLKIAKRFEEERAKFYVAEILLALEYLHNLGVIYRDLKPENVLIDDDGHICLTDFGMAKQLRKGELTYSFVGTPEYLAPEIVRGEGHGQPADWWALGILAYEMMVGLPPFYNRDRNTEKMFAAIQSKDVAFSSKVTLSADAKDFILQLLKKTPEDRLGFKGSDEIKRHKWFGNIDWKLLNERKVNPPFKPKITGDYDVDNFDAEFTREEAYNSVMPNANMNLVNKYQKEFQDFTYAPKEGMLHEK
jgi:serum/glucocorticoid-regulated kinase 2